MLIWRIVKRHWLLYSVSMWRTSESIAWLFVSFALRCMHTFMTASVICYSMDAFGNDVAHFTTEIILLVTMFCSIFWLLASIAWNILDSFGFLFSVVIVYIFFGCLCGVCMCSIPFLLLVMGLVVKLC